MIRTSILTALLALLCIAGAAPVSTAFTYQGRLNRNNGPANGTFDLKFELYMTETGGTPVVAPLEKLAQQISGGLFTVTLDFGGAQVFDGTAYWLAMSARPTGQPFYTATPERTAIRPTPYAIHALNAAGVKDGSITTDSIANGAITGSKLANSAILAPQLNTAVAPAAGQVLAFTGTGLSWVNPAGGSGPWLTGGTHAYYNGGNVGIGTAIPATRLEVRGPLTLNDAGDAAIFTGTGNAELNRYVQLLNSPNYFTASGLKAGGVLVADNYGYAYPGKNDLIVKGRVGIGAVSPVAPLEIDGSWDATGIGHVRLTGNKPTIEWRKIGADAHRHTWLAHAGLTDGLEFWYRRQSLVAGGTDTGWQSKATFWPNGDLTVAGSLNYAGGVSYGGDITATRLILRADPAAPANATVQTTDPNVSNFVPFNSATNRPLNLIVRDATVKQLTITGGADLAEPFAMSHDGIEPGTVVVIDEKNPGKLRRSTSAYDKKVAGIVSGANGIQPGISMIQEDMLEAGENVSLSGRVYVKADRSAGSIEPGDLLTTSGNPGRAMKAADHDQSRGAILGKAMTGLTESEGMVLVLVTLQ